MSKEVYLSYGRDEVRLGSLDDILSIHNPNVSLDAVLCQDTFRSWLLDLLDVVEFHSGEEPVKIAVEIK